MKADKSLSERQRLGAEDQREVLDEQHAIEGAQIGIDINSPAYWAMAARFKG